MKIWLLRRRYSAVGGAERFTQRLAKALNKEGHEVWIASEHWPESQEGIYHVRRIPGHHPSSYAYACLRSIDYTSNDLIFSLERVFRQDIFRAGDGVHACWLERRRQYRSKIRAIWDLWSPKHRLILNLERKVFHPSSTDWIIANSQMVKSEILNHFHFPEEKIRVIYPGVNTAHFHPCLDTSRQSELRHLYGVPQDAVVWCFVGSGFERKGLARAIQIAALQEKPEVWLLVLGSGRRTPFLHIAEKYHFNQRLCFLKDGTSSLDVYHASDAFILPTIYDPCSNATLEASACGLPIITTRANGATEIVSGINLEDPFCVNKSAEQCSIYAKKLEPRRLESVLQQRLDENPYWDATLQLISDVMKRRQNR